MIRKIIKFLIILIISALIGNMAYGMYKEMQISDGPSNSSNNVENANEENLITGTRYMNTEGMLPFENEVADYIKETSNHVLYRVTPIFEGDNLVASGV